MINFMEEGYKETDIIKTLNPIVKKWFFSKFKGFSLPQTYGVMEVHKRNNILISAPTGGTKCVTPDTTILVEYRGKSSIIEANYLVELAKSKGELVKKIGKTGRLYDIPSLNCFSLDNNKIKKNKAMVYFEKTKDKLLKIKTEYGREAKLSRDHPLLVERENCMEWTRAENVKIGDRIAIARKIYLPENEVSFDYKKAIQNARLRAKCLVGYSDFIKLKEKTRSFTVFDCLDSKDFYAIKAILGFSFEKLKNMTGISAASIFNHINKRAKIKNRDKLNLFFKKLLKKINFEKNRLFILDQAGKTHSFLFPYTADKKLVRWIAFVLAEGLIGDYSLGTSILVSQKNRMNLLYELLNNTKILFDMEFKKKKGSDKDYSINSTTFSNFLCDLLNLKKGRGRKVPIPSWILDIPKELKADFINVFLSLEATISEKKYITLDQANKNKIETLNYLLLSFGILSSLNKSTAYATNTVLRKKRVYYGLTIYGIDNLSRFFNFIDIDHPKRDFLLKHLKGKTSGNYVNKFKFDYKKIRNLSRFYKNDEEFKRELGTIYEVVRRTGYITLSALNNLRYILLQLNDHSLAGLIKDISRLLNSDIVWVKVKEKRYFEYEGLVVDLTVPDVHNFIGGYGGIFLHNTLTAFLSVVNELVTLADEGRLENKVYCIYISPLKSLVNDIFVNLERPLKEMQGIAKKEGKEFDIRVAVRTGDTTAGEKAKMLKKAPHILTCTPETLAIILSSYKFVENIKDIKWIIIDEIHSLAENKRGVHLSLSLERLQNLCPNLSRVGLSATAAPLDKIANYLVGEGRDCKIANVQFLKKMDLKVLSPVEDLIETSQKKMHDSLYEMLDNLIQSHKTTLIFTNTRAGTERVVHHLKEKYPKNYVENIGAHHGSLSKKHRLDIENKLREGKLKVCATSTSLELGIDIGCIDLVICLGSPKSVARLTQRLGRSGHQLHETVKGRLIVLDRDDLVECAVMLKSAIERKIDKIHIPENSLDVLAQQIYGMAIADKWNIDGMFNMIKKSYCYRNLTRKDFMDVIDYLTGKHTSLEDRHIYSKIWYDEKTGEIGKRGKMARIIYMTNIGTIPDETNVLVKIGDGVIGTIDESFLERLKRGDIFVLGGNTYEFLFARGMVAQVRPVEGKKPTVPSWFSEMLPLSFDLAMEIQKFRRLMDDKFANCEKKEILDFLKQYLYTDDNAALAIYNYFKEQYLYAEIPHDKKIIIEHYADNEKKYVIFHSLFGRRVNDVLSRAVGFAIAKLQNRDVEIGINDNGFYIAYNRNIQVLRAFEMLKADQLRKIMEKAIEKSEILKRRFRHCAGRALMILREYKGYRKHVGKQQVSSMILLSAVRRISEDFCILREAKREILEDLMDIENAVKVVKDINDGKIELKSIHTSIPTPFAFSNIMEGYTDILKIEDKIEFLRRMHTMVLAKIGKNQKFD